MEARDEMDAGGPANGIRAMAVNNGEDVLATGSKSGQVRAWRLTQHPVESHLCDDKGRSSNTKQSIFAMSFLSSGSAAATCDHQCLAVWDIQASKRVMRFKEDGFNALAEVPVGSVGMLGSQSPANVSCGNQILATVGAGSHSSLLCFDTREGSKSRAARWHLTHSDKSTTFDPREGTRETREHRDFSFGQAAAGGEPRTICAGADGHWVAVGFTTGNVCIVDRRTGRLLHSWQPHPSDTSILHLSQVSSRKLLTVGSDKTAVLWDFSSSRVSAVHGQSSSMDPFVPWGMPQKSSVIRGLHDPEKTMRRFQSSNSSSFFVFIFLWCDIDALFCMFFCAATTLSTFSISHGKRCCLRRPDTR
jgi:WD40 repeat protein